MTRDDFIPMAAIVGLHGIKGELKVRSYADDSSIFQPGENVLIKRARKADETRTIKWVRPHQRALLFSFEDLDDRDQAEELVGSEIWIAKARMPELTDGTYYWFDIIGLDVYQADHAYLGRIQEIVPTGSNDVYVVRDGDRETLVPALKSVILSVDLQEKCMRVNLPEGL